MSEQPVIPPQAPTVARSGPPPMPQARSAPRAGPAPSLASTPPAGSASTARYPWYLRFSWILALVVGTLAYVATFVIMLLTRNPTILPTVLLVGAATIPLTVLLFAQSSKVGPLVPTRTVLVTVALGGLFGLCAAGLGETIAGLLLGKASILLVGVIEETAKLVVPLIVLGLAHRSTRGRRHRDRHRRWHRVRRPGDHGLRVQRPAVAQRRAGRARLDPDPARHPRAGRARGLDRRDLRGPVVPGGDLAQAARGARPGRRLRRGDRDAHRLGCDHQRDPPCSDRGDQRRRPADAHDPRPSRLRATDPPAAWERAGRNPSGRRGICRPTRVVENSRQRLSARASVDRHRTPPGRVRQQARRTP